MKLIQLIKHLLKQKDQQVSAYHLMELEERILRDLSIKDTRMRNSNIRLNPFVHFKPHITNVFAFALLFLAILGTLGFIKVRLNTKEQAVLPQLFKPVSAQELINSAEKAIGSRFYYKRVSWTLCSTDPKEYEQFFRNEGGQYEENLSMTKQMEECIKNNGKLYTTQKIWVDNDKNIVRIDDEIADWQVPDGFRNKKGRERMEEVTPVRIRKGDTIYKFHAIGQKTNGKGLREGLYVEEKTENIEWEDKDFQYAKKTAEETVNDILAFYKNPQKGKVEFEETDEYYKLNLLLPPDQFITNATESQRKKLYLFSTQLFDKKTLKPFKNIQYSFNLEGERKVIGETVYKKFANDFSESIFDLHKAPEGYMFAEGSPAAFDVGIRCENCNWADKLTYTVIPHTYKNAEGKEIQYPSNFYNGKVILPISLKVYESNERFDTKEEALQANNVSFYELPKMQEKTADWIKNDLFFKSNTKIGEQKRYSQLKIEAYDKTGRKKIGESTTIVVVPFSSTKLSSGGNLSFKYITFNTIDENTTHSEAIYTWKNDTKDEIAIVFQIPENISERRAFTCKGYRSSSEYEKRICETTSENGTYETRISSEFTGKDNKKVSTWWRTDLYYQHIHGIIQFNKASKECDEGEEDNYKSADLNVEQITCQDNVIPREEKEQIVVETKALMTKIAKEWK